MFVKPLIRTNQETAKRPPTSPIMAMRTMARVFPRSEDRNRCREARSGPKNNLQLVQFEYIGGSSNQAFECPNRTLLFQFEGSWLGAGEGLCSQASLVLLRASLGR